MNYIEIEDIDRSYYRAKYVGIPVIVNKKTGFVNLTFMCKSKGADVRTWRQMVKMGGDDLVLKLVKRLALREEADVFIQEYGSQETSGIFGHPDLVPHVALWLCGSVALWLWPDLALETTKLLDIAMFGNMKAKVEHMEEAGGLTR